MLSVNHYHSRVIFSLFADLISIISQLDLPAPQDAILTQGNYLFVFCNCHAQYFFELSLWVIESSDSADNLILLYLQCSEKTLVIRDKDPILATREWEGLNVCHFHVYICFELGNDQLVICSLSDLNLAFCGPNKYQVWIPLKTCDWLDMYLHYFYNIFLQIPSCKYSII